MITIGSSVRTNRRGWWRAAVATAAAGGLLVTALTAPAEAATGGPDGGGYTFTDSTESGGPAGGPFTSIAATGTDIGNHGDEEMTAVDLPFPITLYDAAGVTSVNVNTNGDVQLDSDNTAYEAPDLPSAYFYTTVMPYWTDLVTNGDGDGIFTQTFGSAPNRQFVIEWDAHTYDADPNAGTPERFQAVFTENSPAVEFRYLDVTATDQAHVVGIQGGDGSNDEYLQYSGGSVDATSDLAVEFTRVAPNSATHLSANPAGGSVYGQSVALTARVARTDGGTTRPTGTVSFSFNGTPLGTAPVGSSGRAVLATRRIPTAYGIIRAAYSGDANTAASAGLITDYTVDPSPTTTTISPADGSTYVYGRPITATVRPVSPGGLIPAGYVYWYDDTSGRFLAASTTQNGVATLPATTLPPGQYQLEADYTGSTNYQYSSQTDVGVTIIRAPVTVRMTTSANPAPAGTKVRFVATIRPEYPGARPTGQIVFFKNGQPARTVAVNAYGQAGTTFPAGDYSLIAAYQSDTNYLPEDSNTIYETQG